MRLDKHTKQAILRSIVDDIPKPTVQAARHDIQAALVKSMSPLARKLYKQNPAALAKDRVGYDHGFDYSAMVVVGDADFDAVMRPYVEANDQRRDVYNKLKGIIEGCTTLKQLKILLPEFEKYMPTETAPTKNLPAVANVVADLTKLGWPKGAQQ
jgi:phosphoglycolate phosphatase-like HAD superfamily hydrolase